MHMKVGISNTMQVNHNESNDVFLATIKEDQISVYQNIPPIYYRSLEFVNTLCLSLALQWHIKNLPMLKKWKLNVLLQYRVEREMREWINYITGTRKTITIKTKTYLWSLSIASVVIEPTSLSLWAVILPPYNVIAWGFA